MDSPSSFVLLPRMPRYGEDDVISTQVGMILGNGAVLTATETQIYKKVDKVVEENKKLRQVLCNNNDRLKKHTEDCVNWKKKYKDKEAALKNELLGEKKTIQVLKNKIASYEAYANTNFGVPNKSLFDELTAHCEKLQSIMSLHPSPQENNDEEEYVFVQNIAQDTRDTIEAFTRTNIAPDQNDLQRFRMQLLNIQESCKNHESSIGKPLQETITAIQESVRKHSNAPNSLKGNNQQISWSQYLDLQSKFEMSVEENRLFRLQIEELTDNFSSCKSKNKDLTSDLESAKQKISELTKELADTDEKMKSMQSAIEAKSIEFVDLFPAAHLRQIEELNRKVDLLEKSCEAMKNENATITNENAAIKNRNARLESDYKETMESYDKVDAENSELLDKVEELKALLVEKQMKEDNTDYEVIAESKQKADNTEELDDLKRNIDEKETQIEQLRSQLKQVEENNANIGKERDDFKSKTTDYQRKVETLRRRETKDADKIESLKKENSDMKNHIENLQNLINKKTDKDGEVESLELRSMLFVNKSDADSSICESITISTDEVGAIDSTTSDDFIKPGALLSNSDAILIQQLQEENERLQNELIMKEDNMQQLLKENSDMDERVKSMSERQEHDALDEDRQTRMEEENENLRSNLEIMQDDFQQVKKQHNEEMNQLLSQLQYHEHELHTKHAHIEAMEHDMSKSKRDYQCLWNNYELKVSHLNDLEGKLPKQQQYIDKLTAEVVGARDLIEQKDMDVKQMRKELHEQNKMLKRMKDDLETLPALQIQVDVYRNDFNAEREAREKQQNELIQQRERVSDLMIENRHIREQLQSYGNSQLSSLARRHGAQSLQYRAPTHQQYDTMPHYGVRSTGGQPNYPQDPQNRRAGSSGSSPYGSNPTLYGRGGDNRNSMDQVGDGGSSDRSDDVEQRCCPKCQKVFPDLDTLQIHLMECLDN